MICSNLAHHMHKNDAARGRDMANCTFRHRCKKCAAMAATAVPTECAAKPLKNPNNLQLTGNTSHIIVQDTTHIT